MMHESSSHLQRVMNTKLAGPLVWQIPRDSLPHQLRSRRQWDRRWGSAGCRRSCICRGVQVLLCTTDTTVWMEADN